MPDPVDPAGVLAEAISTKIQRELAKACAEYLSERAGGGAFACVPDGEGAWTLHRVEEFGHGWTGPRWTGELEPDEEEGDPLYRLALVPDDETSEP